MSHAERNEEGAAKGGARRVNLSEWALTHRPLVLFFLIAAVLMGALSYRQLGRAEDPSFTFKVMVIQTAWPGATAEEVERFVTDKIEKTLESVPYYDYARSYSKPGLSVITLSLKDSMPKGEVKDIWYQVRKKVGDMKGTLPDGVLGPYFNDEFGDVYSVIYALTGDGYSPADLKSIAEQARERLLRVKNVGKVELIGEQDQKVYVEISAQRLANYGLSVDSVIQALQKENAVSSAGAVDSGDAKVFVRLDMGFETAEKVKAIPLETGGRVIRLGDVAEIKRGYADPTAYTIRYNGQNAVGLGVVMAEGGNALDLGKAVEAEMARVLTTLPVGVEIGVVANQPHVVEESVGEFMESLVEALAIVMAVSFLSLGWRTGIVVALAVPLVLALTFVFMELMGIDLHRVSLGALIIALGLLVDDAIIAVEMMMVKMEEGWDRLKAGAYAWTSAAFPMLSGTVVTAAGFVPVGFAKSSAGEYTNAIFWVVGAALLLSWLVAVVFTPFLGYALLPTPKRHEGHDLYQGGLYRVLRGAVVACIRFRWITIGVTVAAFVAALGGFTLVQQQFFPSSARPELLVDLRLAEGSSYAATAKEVERLEAMLKTDENVDHWVAYTGGGSPRFVLTLDQQLQNANFAQFVVMTKGLEQREALAKKLEEIAETDFPAARVRIGRLELGPPVGYPVQFRVTGENPRELRKIAYELRDRMKANPHLTSVNLDWDELSKRVRLEVDTAKARALGVSKQDLANAMQLLVGGVPVTQYREGTDLIDVVVRTPDQERLDLGAIGDLTIRTAKGAMPVSQVATVHYDLEEPVLWRRARVTTMVVRADVAPGTQSLTATQEVTAQIADLRASLPDGYSIVTGGASEESAKSQGSIIAMMPLMLFIMVAALMLQLQSFSQVFMVFVTAPLGLIGVTAALLIFHQPFGFVALLGVIALAGIIMRNSVILVDQIEQDLEAGLSHWDAIVESTVRRTRPIVLTATAAILAMIPLASSVFWGPMAVAIMGGLTGATFLTIFFLPALYAAWFRVKRPVGANREVALA
jgi:multidrug efflux pump